MDVTDLELAIKVAQRQLQETGGTISTETWATIAGLTRDEAEMEVVMESARGWRRDRGLAEDADFIVGGLAL